MGKLGGEKKDQRMVECVILPFLNAVLANPFFSLSRIVCVLNALRPEKEGQSIGLPANTLQ